MTKCHSLSNDCELLKLLSGRLVEGLRAPYTESLWLPRRQRERAYDLIHRNEPCIVRYPIRIIKSFEARTDAANIIIYRLWPCVKCWTRVEGKETWFEATRHEKESERLDWIFMQCRVRRKFSFLKYDSYLRNYLDLDNIYRNSKNIRDVSSLDSYFLKCILDLDWRY